MPASPEQVAALLSKYKVTVERVIGERDALSQALAKIAFSDHFLDGEDMAQIARDALANAVTRPDGGDAA